MRMRFSIRGCASPVEAAWVCGRNGENCCTAGWRLVRLLPDKPKGAKDTKARPRNEACLSWRRTHFPTIRKGLCEVIVGALLPRGNDADRFHEVLVLDLRRFSPQRQHSRLDTDGLELRSVEVLAGSCQLLKVHVLLIYVHLPAVDAQDPRPGFF
eukprot:scaffold5910_cov239-Pinguiococcus_pyrenoidosus.AAC.3